MALSRLLPASCPPLPALVALATHAPNCMPSQARVLFNRYDQNGDGHLSLDEFSQMLADIEPWHERLPAPRVEQMYNTLLSIGNGAIGVEDLQQMLYERHMNERQMTGALQPSGIQLAMADVEQSLEFTKLTHAWESVRNAVTVNISDERMRHITDNLPMIIRLQSHMRGLKMRLRRRAVVEDGSPDPKLKRATLKGQRTPSCKGFAVGC